LTKEKRTVLIMVAILAPFLIIAIQSYHKAENTKTATQEAYQEENGEKTQQENTSDFELQNIDGSTVNFSSFKGKILVVNFWATWCKYCVMEIPGFNSVYAKYKDKGVEIIGISLDRSPPEHIKSFVKSRKIKYPIFLGTREAVLKFGKVQGLPTTFFIDRSGKLINSKVGLIHENELEDAVKSLL